MATLRVLLIGGDPTFRAALTDYLRRKGYAMTGAPSAQKGLKMTQTLLPDLVILGAMPPRRRANLCRQLRTNAITRLLPMLSIAGEGELVNQGAGWLRGAGEVMCHPFGAMLNRIKELESLLEGTRVRSSTIEHAGLTIDWVQRRVWVDGREISLTWAEFELLACLTRQPGRVFTAPELSKIVKGATKERSVSKLLIRLRNKIGKPNLIENIRGVGYCLRDADAQVRD